MPDPSQHNVIQRPDGVRNGFHPIHMDAIRNLPEFVLDFVSRPGYIAFYLGFVGFWCLWLAFRGLRLGNTKAFGWLPEDAVGAAAIEKGRVWLALAAALLVSGSALWFTSA